MPSSIQKQMTKKITPFDFAQIKKGLRMGDIAKIVGRTGYTSATVQTALKGDSITDASHKIIPVALEIVKENQIEAERVYKAGREAFDRKKKETNQ